VTVVARAVIGAYPLPERATTARVGHLAFRRDSAVEITEPWLITPE
jgi:hypothetical protein